MAAPPVAVVGLGLMGGAIADNLRSAGYTVFGFDPLQEARDRARASGITLLESVRDLPSSVQVVFTSLPSPAALAVSVEAMGSVLPDGCVVAELSTLALADKESARLALEKFGVEMLDCPISGTGAQAVVRDLSVYVSGDPAVWEPLSDVFKAFGRPEYVGGFGAGTRLKYIANLLVAIHNVATAEAMSMAEVAGIDMTTAINVLRQGAGNSRIFELRAPLMARRSYAPPTMKLDVWEKDMRLIDGFARELGVATPLFDATRSIYDAVTSRQPHDDTAAVFEVIRSKTDLREDT